MYRAERLIYLIEQYLAVEKFPKENSWYGISMYEALRILILNKDYRYSSIQAIYDHAIASRRRLTYMQDLDIMEVF